MTIRHANITVRALLESDRRVASLERAYASNQTLRSLVALMHAYRSVGGYKPSHNELGSVVKERLQSHYSAYITLLKEGLFKSFKGGRIPNEVDIPTFRIRGGSPPIIKVGTFEEQGKTYFAIMRAGGWVGQRHSRHTSLALTVHAGPLPDDSKYGRATFYVDLNISIPEFFVAIVTKKPTKSVAIERQSFETLPADGSLPTDSVEEVIRKLVKRV